MVGGRIIADITLPATSAGTGTKQTSVLDPYDLSRCRMIEMELNVTAASTNATDLLDVYLQDSDDAVIWNDRIHIQVLGNVSASSTAPYRKRGNITSAIAEQSPEKVYVETGSTGGAHIAADTVVNGPFPPPYRKTTTTGTRLSTWRVLFVQTDISGTTSFTAEAVLRAQEWSVA